MSDVYYYAQINDENICEGVSQLTEIDERSNMIELDSYDTSVMGKMWTGTEWVENPNPPEQSSEPTAQDIMDKLNDMSGDQVSIATLDAAYREGVNAYAG